MPQLGEKGTSKMASRIERVGLSEMSPGQLADFYVVLSERIRRATRDGKPFYSVKFRDRGRTASVPIWDNSPLFEACDRDWKVGDHFKVRAVYQEHDRYGPQIEIQNIRKAVSEDWVDGYDPESFVQATRFDVEDLFAELIEGANGIGDRSLRELVLRLLHDNEEAVRVFPAASRNHHSYKGGLLEHTVSVLRTGLYFAEKYSEYYPDLDPPLNRDLIIAGCILHDIGKIHELDAQGENTPYTIAGNLVGHILIGRDMIREAARQIEDLSPELLILLEHIILSHQGTAEWGSPKPPMFPEALLVHYADDVDAKMNTFVHILQGAEGDDPFTDTQNLFRRKLLRKRSV